MINKLNQTRFNLQIRPKLHEPVLKNRNKPNESVSLNISRVKILPELMIKDLTTTEYSYNTKRKDYSGERSADKLRDSNIFGKPA